MELTGPGKECVAKCVRDACVEYRRTFGQKDRFSFPGLPEEDLREFDVTVTEVENTLVASLWTITATYEIDRSEVDVEAFKRRRDSVVKWMADRAPAGESPNPAGPSEVKPDEG